MYTHCKGRNTKVYAGGSFYVVWGDERGCMLQSIARPSGRAGHSMALLRMPGGKTCLWCMEAAQRTAVCARTPGCLSWPHETVSNN